jgi:SulP family sulfate permease
MVDVCIVRVSGAHYRVAVAADTKLKGGYLTEAGIKIVGKMDASFPTPSMPDLGRASKVLVAAIFVMFVGVVEAISVAKTYGVLKGYEIEPTREFVALGCANIVGSMFGTLPSLSPLSRSAINSDAGARSQLSLMVRCMSPGVTVSLRASSALVLIHSLPSSACVTAFVCRVCAAACS